MMLRVFVLFWIFYCIRGQTVTITLGGTGATASQGRVDITRNGITGTVCNDRFDDLAAAVVCRQLNFPNGGTAVTDGRFGQGTGPIWLDDVTCQGNELHIEQCISRAWNESNCNHDEDVGVICNTNPVPSSSVSPATSRAPATVQPSNCTTPSPNIRLIGPTNLNGIGFVEVRRNNIWGSICDDLWGRQDAQVVCRMLCLNPAVAQAGAPVDINYIINNVSSTYLMDGVECVGTENDIELCPRSSQIDCVPGSKEYASVTCVPLQNTQPSAPIPELECSGGKFYARFSLAHDPRLEAKHLSIFYPYNGPCELDKPTTTDTVSIVIPYSQCGTKTDYNTTHIVYTNSIKYDYTYIENQIVRVNTYRIEVSCEFPRDLGSNEGYTPLTETVTQKAPGRFTLGMTFYNDTFNTALNGSIELTLGEWLNVAVSLESIDPNLKLIVPDCKATPTSDPNDPTFFNLFNNKCPSDPTLGFFPINSTVFGFRYQTFKFVAFSNVVIQCDAFVCLLNEKNAECDRSCNVTTSGSARRKRDVTEGREVYRVVSQPLRFTADGAGVVIDRGDGWEGVDSIVTTRVPSSTTKATTASSTPIATTKVTYIKTTTPPATTLPVTNAPTTTTTQAPTTLKATTSMPQSTAVPTTPKQTPVYSTTSSAVPSTPKQTPVYSTTSTAQPTSKSTTVKTVSSIKSTTTSSTSMTSTKEQTKPTPGSVQDTPAPTTPEQSAPKPGELVFGGLGGKLTILSHGLQNRASAFIYIVSSIVLFLCLLVR